ncbi:MAG: hypothetical protein Q9165_008685 [Trypethelium subeluteriae]
MVISNGGTISSTITAEESQHGPTWTQSPVPYGISPTAGTTPGALSAPATVNSSTGATSTEFSTSTEILSSIISQPPFANISGATASILWSYSTRSPSSKIPWRSFTSSLADSSTSEAAASSPIPSTKTSISALANTTRAISFTSSASPTIPWGSFTTTLSSSFANSTANPYGSLTSSLSSGSAISSLIPLSPLTLTVSPIPAASTLSSLSDSMSNTTATSSILATTSFTVSASVASVNTNANTSCSETSTSPVSVNVTNSLSSSGPTTPASSPSTASQTSSTPSTSCGPSGNFVVNFDDLPAGPVPTDNTNTTDPLDSEDEPAIFSPFHDLFFSNGFYYVPPPSDPYRPSSPPQLAVFLPNKTGQPLDHPDIGTLYTGELGAGPDSASSAFAFNAYSARLGCDWRGPSDCTMHIYGYRYDVAMGNQTQVAHQMAELPACVSGSGCELTLTTFTAEFVNVTGVRFEAVGGSGEALKWFMDDLALGWANNTCAAAGERANVGMGSA